VFFTAETKVSTKSSYSCLVHGGCANRYRRVVEALFIVGANIEQDGKTFFRMDATRARCRGPSPDRDAIPPAPWSPRARCPAEFTSSRVWLNGNPFSQSSLSFHHSSQPAHRHRAADARPTRAQEYGHPYREEALYTALGGSIRKTVFHPARCRHQQMKSASNDPVYIGWRNHRVRGPGIR